MTRRDRSPETWFVRRGIPHFIHQYSATEDIFTRAAWLLGLVFIVEIVGAANIDWPWWANSLALIGGAAILLGAFAGLNIARGRPPFARPQRIGTPEIAFFVLVPSLLPLVFGGHARAAIGTVALNLGLVGIIYIVTSYALVALTIWAVGKTFQHLWSMLGLFTRALPILLLFFMFLFVNAEAWQITAAINQFGLVTVIGLFFVVAALFVIARLPSELRPLATFSSWDEAIDVARPTGVDITLPTVPIEEIPRPGRKEWGNLGLVVLFNQGAQILTVSLLVGAFFIAFGVLAIDMSVIAEWTGGVHEIGPSLSLAGRRIGLTAELLKVASFLAGFAGLYFSVTLMTDPRFREDFLERTLVEVREAVAVRAIYRAGSL